MNLDLKISNMSTFNYRQGVDGKMATLVVPYSQDQTGQIHIYDVSKFEFGGMRLTGSDIETQVDAEWKAKYRALCDNALAALLQNLQNDDRPPWLN